jgi:protein-tyrosine phosphatase
MKARSGGVHEVMKPTEPASWHYGSAVRIELEGAANVRDVGGVAAGNRKVATGRLLRSETPELYTDADVEHMVGFRDVTLVVDLREVAQPHDGSGAIGRRVRRETVDYVALSGGRMPLGHADLEEHRWFAAQLDRSGAAWVAFLETLCTNDTGATLVHCQSGKDRTGFVCALTLRLVGVADDDIIADYLASAPVNGEVMHRLEEAGYSFEHVPPFVLAVPARENIEMLLTAIDTRWPDLRDYIAANGGGPELADRARLHLLA